MKRLLFAILLLFSVPAIAQRPALNSPVIRFSDQNGSPLAGGKLYSYAAGTSTPLATYVDATSGTLNTNPVVLDSTGSGRVFLSPAVYKLVLTDANGVVQWTADNVGQGTWQSSVVNSVFGRVGVVTAQVGDYNCGQITGAICSLPTPPTLYNQTIQVSGSPEPQEVKLNFIPGISGSVGNPTVTAGGSGYTGAPSVVFTGGSCLTEPTGSTTVASGAVTALVLVTKGSGCTSAPTAAFSGGGGTGAAATVTVIPDGITCIDNPGAGSTDCMFTFGSGGGGSAIAVTDVTSLRGFGSVFPNTTTSALYVSGWANTASGGSVGTITCNIGPTSGLGEKVWSQINTATNIPGDIGFACMVPAGYSYQITTSGAIGSLAKWFEYTGFGGGGGGGGGGFTAGGDLSGTSISQTVVGLKSIAFCSGFSPTNGQFIELTTGGSPNPCWTAAATGGGYTPPTGTGFVHITAGAQDSAARAVDLSSADATGTLAAAREPVHSADVTNTAGSLAMKVVAINNTNMAGLATGILKNTTGTGVPSIAAAADVISTLGYTPSSSPTIPTAGLLGSYNFTETSGQLLDRSGHGNNCTVVNSTGLARTGIGYAYTSTSAETDCPTALRAANTFYFAVQFGLVSRGAQPSVLSTSGTLGTHAIRIANVPAAGAGSNDSYGIVVQDIGTSGGGVYLAQSTDFFAGTHILAITCPVGSQPLAYLDGHPAAAYNIASTSCNNLTNSGFLSFGPFASDIYYFGANFYSGVDSDAQVATTSAAMASEALNQGAPFLPTPYQTNLKYFFGLGDSITCGAYLTGCVGGNVISPQAWEMTVGTYTTVGTGYTSFGNGTPSSYVEYHLAYAPYDYAYLCNTGAGQSLGALFSGTNNYQMSYPGSALAWAKHVSELDWSFVNQMQGYGCTMGVVAMIDRLANLPGTLGPDGSGNSYEQDMFNYNTYLRQNWKVNHAAFFVDLGSDPIWGAVNAALSTTYYANGSGGTDYIHPSLTGQQHISQAAACLIDDVNSPKLGSIAPLTATTVTLGCGMEFENFDVTAASITATLGSSMWQTGRDRIYCNATPASTANTLTINAPGSEPFVGGATSVTIARNTCTTFTATFNQSTTTPGDNWQVTNTGSASGGATVIQVNGTPTSTATPVNLQTSTANSVGLTITPSNPSAGNVKLEVTGGAYSGTAANLSGTPALPNGTTATTQAVNDSTTKLATDAFVVGQAGTATPLIDGSAAVGTSVLYARQDHVHPTDTTRAPVASPTFTGNATAGSGGFILPASGTATSGANFGSRPVTWFASYWGGASAGVDDWGSTIVLGTGTNPTSTLHIGHDVSGSPGFAAVEVPALQVDSISSGTAPICANGTNAAFTTSGCIVPTALSCQPGLGDGLNAIPAATYLTTTCRNETGRTWTITAIRCVADAGSSTCAVTNGAGTALLSPSTITGTSTYANGTQSGTTTIASGDYLKITYVTDGTTKQIGIDVAGTY